MRADVANEAFGIISTIARRVRAIVDGGVTWFKLADDSFAEVQNLYVSAEIDDAHVHDWFAEGGLWSTIADPDGTVRFVGVPIPPQAG